LLAVFSFPAAPALCRARRLSAAGLESIVRQHKHFLLVVGLLGLVEVKPVRQCLEPAARWQLASLRASSCITLRISACSDWALAALQIRWLIT
jgi:hypothetical protein